MTSSARDQPCADGALPVLTADAALALHHKLSGEMQRGFRRGMAVEYEAVLALLLADRAPFSERQREILSAMRQRNDTGAGCGDCTYCEMGTVEQCRHYDLALAWGETLETSPAALSDGAPLTRQDGQLRDGKQ